MAKFAEGETVQVHFTNGKVWTGTVSHVRPLGGRDRAEFALEVETARKL